ncbi:hypothetical protein EC396_08890 [Lutibacter sp. HS1-25]|nr:hypothetical protein EC396_08890 [Lutibacter sp. HS1-25]
MAFVVLFTTMSFSFSEHYCGDHLVDFAMFSKAESCGMAMESAPANSDCNTFIKDCCSDIIKQVKGQDELSVVYTNLNLEQQVFLASFTYTYLNLFEGFDTKINTFKDYSPPLADRDLNVLYGVFRI